MAELRAFVPAIGPLVSALARRPWSELGADPPELARIALEARQVTGASHLVCPLDPRALVAACGDGATLLDDEIHLAGARFGRLDDLEPAAVLASSWLAPQLELARLAGSAARIPLAARLPSPRRLAGQVGAAAGDEDSLLAAADLCAALALELLRAGASLLLVDPAEGLPSGSDDSVAMLARTAASFNVPVLATDEPPVLVVDPAAPRTAAPTIPAGDAVVITSRPVRGDDDLGRLRELAMIVTATGGEARGAPGGTAGSGPAATPAASATASASTAPRAAGSAAARPAAAPAAAVPPAHAAGTPRDASERPSGDSSERFSVGIDMGGTFTDAFVTSGRRTASAKVPTIRFDLTRSLVAALRAAAEAMGLEVGAFMRRVAILKVATTIGTNAVIEGTGTRVGLVVGRGHEVDLYAPERPDALLARFIGPNDVLAIHPGAGADEILDACRRLVANGVRQVIVALPRSATTHEDESRVRKVIRARYPEHYLRSVPLQLSTDVTASGEDEVRTATAVVNAYLHRDMAHLLSRAEQELRAIGLSVPVLVVHASSGVARVATSIAIGTYSAGPSAGLSGAEEVAGQLSDGLVLTADMGGTTLDLGMVREGRCEVEVRPSIAGVRVALPTNRTESFGTGGGSLITLSAGEVRVGPASAGAVPGPAAFGRGGERPTVTDVDIVAGLLEGGQVLGGEVTLSGTAAAAAVGGLAAELGVPLPVAAARVESAIDRQLGEAMAGFLADRGVDPATVTLYGFGGAGPLHFARAATVAGIRRLRTFPYGPVFSAFGCTAVDVRHRYELLVPLGGLSRKAACTAFDQLVRRAGWDVAAEGFGGRPGTCRLAVEGPDGHELGRTDPIPFGSGVAGPLVDATLPLPAEATTLALIVDVPMDRRATETAGTAAVPAEAAPTRADDPAPGTPTPAMIVSSGSREIWWAAEPTLAPVVAAADLPEDRPVPGPLLVMDGEATSVVPPEWTVRRRPDRSLLWERPTGAAPQPGSRQA